MRLVPGAVARGAISVVRLALVASTSERRGSMPRTSLEAPSLKGGNGRTFALTLGLPARRYRSTRFAPFRERELAVECREETPGSYELFWYPQHPNEVFGCRAARTRCGPVVADPPYAPSTLRCPANHAGSVFSRGIDEARAGAIRRPLVPMANPSSQVFVVSGHPFRRPKRKTGHHDAVSSQRIDRPSFFVGELSEHASFRRRHQLIKNGAIGRPKRSCGVRDRVPVPDTRCAVAAVPIRAEVLAGRTARECSLPSCQRPADKSLDRSGVRPSMPSCGDGTPHAIDTQAPAHVRSHRVRWRNNKNRRLT